jgi:hypothetical protein
VFRRDVQRGTLSIDAVGDIQMRPMQTLGIALADAIGIAAASGSLRQASLDHILGGPQESLKELISPTHHSILRYGRPDSVSRGKSQKVSKMFWRGDSYVSAGL